MTKQEQIDEIAKDIHRVCTACSVEMFDEYTCDRCQAKLLIKKGYRKLPEDSVVLPREEYEKLKSLYDTQKGAIMTSKIGDLPLTVAGLRKAVDEIARLNNIEAELQELNIKYYNEAKDLRRELAKAEAENEKRLKASEDFATKHCRMKCEIAKMRIKEFADKIKTQVYPFLQAKMFSEKYYITGNPESDIYREQINQNIGILKAQDILLKWFKVKIDELLKDYEK